MWFEPDIETSEEVQMCFVTQELLNVRDLVWDAYDGHWFKKGTEEEYNNTLSLMYEWSLEEKQDNLKRLLK